MVRASLSKWQNLVPVDRSSSRYILFKLALTLCFETLNIFVLTTQCVRVLLVFLPKHSDCFLTQHYPVNPCNREGICFLWRRKNRRIVCYFLSKSSFPWGEIDYPSLLPLIQRGVIRPLPPTPSWRCACLNRGVTLHITSVCNRHKGINIEICALCTIFSHVKFYTHVYIQVVHSTVHVYVRT
jgi:hypothetical protein